MCGDVGVWVGGNVEMWECGVGCEAVVVWRCGRGGVWGRGGVEM